jgi:signal recognition particle subunit SRP54
MLAGLQGSGKTTTSVKLALFARRDCHRPRVVGLDRQRPGAMEQLRVLCHNNELPFMTSGAPAPELAKAALDEARRRNCDLVILDTAGRLHIDEPLVDELRRIKAAVRVDATILVADSMSGQDAVNAASGFHEQVGLDGAILTKVDGDARGGAALSIRAVTGVPILFAGVGEKVSELEPFRPERLASRILGMGDVLTLIERAEAARDQERAAEVERNLLEGRMTLDDMLEQLRQLQRMGPLEGILGMLPGAGNLKKMLNQVPDDREIRRIEAIILSMTPGERRRPETLNGSRRRRVARGSGRTVAEVNQLLRGFEQMQQMVKMLGGGKGGKKLRRLAARPGALDPGMFKLPH